MTEIDWHSELEDSGDGDDETVIAGDEQEVDEALDEAADVARRRQLLQDQIDLGGPMTQVYSELLVALDERVARQKAEAKAQALIESQRVAELDVDNDPALQDALRADMARIRADTDAKVLAEFMRQWRAEGHTPAEIATKVEYFKAQQAALAAFETGNAGSRFDGSDSMWSHPVWREREKARWEAERGRLGAAEFSTGWEEELAEAEAEMNRIIKRDAARR